MTNTRSLPPATGSTEGSGEAGLGNGNVTDFTGDYRVNTENFGTEFTADTSFGRTGSA